MTRETAEAELRVAEADLVAIRRRMDEAAATGHIDMELARELSTAAEAAQGRAWHLRRELRKLTAGGR